jgi:hypothetical protein
MLSTHLHTSCLACLLDVQVVVNLNECDMLDAEEVHGIAEGEDPDEEHTAEPRPIFVVEVTNAKSKTASFLCMLTTDAALQVVKVPDPISAAVPGFHPLPTLPCIPPPQPQNILSFPKRPE